jgi:predicted nucleotidyltransferase
MIDDILATRKNWTAYGEAVPSLKGEGGHMTGSGHIEDDRRLAEVVRRLREVYKPERIYLFGSMARGDAGPDSDYDLLLVVPDDASLEQQDSDLAYRTLRGTGIGADVVVWTRSRFERRKHVICSLPATVLREGRLLHAA